MCGDNKQHRNSVPEGRALKREFLEVAINDSEYGRLDSLVSDVWEKARGNAALVACTVAELVQRKETIKPKSVIRVYARLVFVSSRLAASLAKT